jgi:hypothetical protein
MHFANITFAIGVFAVSKNDVLLGNAVKFTATANYCRVVAYGIQGWDARFLSNPQGEVEEIGVPPRLIKI